MFAFRGVVEVGIEVGKRRLVGNLSIGHDHHRRVSAGNLFQLAVVHAVYGVVGHRQFSPFVELLFVRAREAYHLVSAVGGEVVDVVEAEVCQRVYFLDVGNQQQQSHAFFRDEVVGGGIVAVVGGYWRSLLVGFVLLDGFLAVDKRP